MTTHIMLDLETWGKRPGCDIRSIGAVVFSPVYGGHVDDGELSKIKAGVYALKFYVACDNPTGRYRNGVFMPELATGSEDYRKYPLTCDPETVQWWNDQSEEAQQAFNNPVDLRDALIQFGFWIASMCQDGVYDEKRDSDEFRIWANDPQFDTAILDAAFRAVGLPIPWHYRAPRSFRTIVELAGMTREDMRKFDAGTTHHALDDAISQAKIVCEAYKRLGLTR